MLPPTTYCGHIVCFVQSLPIVCCVSIDTGGRGHIVCCVPCGKSSHCVLCQHRYWCQRSHCMCALWEVFPLCAVSEGSGSVDHEASVFQHLYNPILL